MILEGRPTRSIRRTEDGRGVVILDQRKLPWEVQWVELRDVDAAAVAIREMWTRGAPMIGATAAYGYAMALAADPGDASLQAAYETLFETRPTAINLRWALDAVRAAVADLPEGERAAAAFRRADEICDEDAELCRAIGEHGLELFRELHARNPDRPLNILTHCNAGWIATVDWGTALAPVYLAHDAGIPVHVWVDETRPRNQGALLTAFELRNHGVPHTVIADNAGGLLMMKGQVDAVVVGTDRVTRNGDVCNKIGTYLKALAAKDNSVPFYVALPSPTIDWTVSDGIREIPIEERSGEEVSLVWGKTASGEIAQVRVSPEATPAGNPAFDVTPARLVTGLITERGVAEASRSGLKALFPEH